MTTSILGRIGGRRGAPLLPLLAAMTAGGCSARSSIEISAPQALSAEVREILGTDWRSPEYHEARIELQRMGPEVDSILVALAEDPRERTAARADALVLLADRRSPLALPTLERALQYDNARIRAAAVQGLSRLSRSSNLAMELIRRATQDRSRTVRLSALESLNVDQVEAIREVLEREVDPEIREVGLQLVLLAESRGAPLAVDARGALRTAALEDEPQIVFRPVTVDSATGVAHGDLRIELPARPDIPLSASATVVANVVPAFFSPDRAAVVVEDDGRIYVHHLATREQRTIGAGIAPRPIPFTYQFVFLREKRRSRTPGAIETEVVYDVYRSSFTTAPVEWVGEVIARVRPDVNGGESPARWMIVDELDGVFFLRANNLDPFMLPTPVWGTGRSNGAGAPRN